MLKYTKDYNSFLKIEDLMFKTYKVIIVQILNIIL